MLGTGHSGAICPSALPTANPLSIFPQTPCSPLPRPLFAKRVPSPTHQVDDTFTRKSPVAAPELQKVALIVEAGGGAIPAQRRFLQSGREGVGQRGGLR